MSAGDGWVRRRSRRGRTSEGRRRPES